MANRGRPSTFKPEYGEKILELMEQGLSLTAACADLNVSRRTVTAWRKDHAEFDELVTIGQHKRTAYLERRLLGASDSATVTSSIFALKNADPAEWRDKREVEATGKDGKDLLPQSNDVDLARKLAFLLASGIAKG